LKGGTILITNKVENILNEKSIKEYGKNIGSLKSSALTAAAFTVKKLIDN
jgi:hypothetical protein